MSDFAQSKKHLITKTFLWILFASVSWISIALIYRKFGIQWLEDTDSGWYWQIVNNLQIYDPAIQPLFPAIVRGLIEIFPRVDQTTIGQFISFICYVIAVPFIYDLFKKLEVKKPVFMTIFWAMFPFVGITMSVYPRANALLFLLTALCFWGYIKGNDSIFVLSAAFLPLVHKSALFFLVFLIPIALIEKKIKWWVMLLSVIPTAIYIVLGSVSHGSLLWYFQSYKGITPLTSFPLADGLIGTLALGINGNWTELIQGIIVAVYFLFSIYLLFSKVWIKRLYLLSTILPIILYTLVLPAREIWSMVNYSTFSIIPFALLNWHDENHVGKPKYQVIYIVAVIALYVSQIVYTFIDLHYYGRI